MDEPEGAGPVTFAIVTPSRGLVHSRTVEAVMANLRHAPRKAFRGWYFTHDLPIPECDEQVAERALSAGVDALWFVEEDVIPPAVALAVSLHMLDDFDIVAVDYPVGSIDQKWGCLVRDDEGDILWCGLGCTLIRREVFDRLDRPWFTSDWRYVKRGDRWERVAVEPDAPRWGQQDIHFCMEARRAGFRIGQVGGLTAHHASVEAMGKPGENAGWHSVQLRTTIEKQWPGPE